MNIWKHSVLLFLLSLLININAQSQNYRFEDINLQEGQLHTRINSIIQDHLGFMWIAVNGGVYRYDGNRLKGVYHDVLDSTTINSPHVYKVAEDKHGQIWISTGLGINLLDRRTGKFRGYLPNGDALSTKGSNYIADFYIDSANRIWVTNRRKLYLFDQDLEEFKIFDSRNESESGAAIRIIQEGKDGSIWCSSSRGLVRVNPYSFYYDHVEPIDNIPSKLNNINSIGLADDGNFWLATSNGMAQYDPSKNLFIDCRSSNQSGQ